MSGNSVIMPSDIEALNERVIHCNNITMSTKRRLQPRALNTVDNGEQSILTAESRRSASGRLRAAGRLAERRVKLQHLQQQHSPHTEQ